VDVEKDRAELEAMAKGFRSAADLRCDPVDANGVSAEWVAPPTISSDRVIVYLHGGSYYLGSIQTHRTLAGDIAQAAGARALIIDYRLAPEHPFPAAVEDAQSAYEWLLAEGIDPGRIVLVGDSAGGGLALALIIALRDAGRPLPAGIACISPWTDLACTGESWRSKARVDTVIDPEGLRKAAQQYLNATDPLAPLASPLYADLQLFPPLLIQVGSNEILLSDSTQFAERTRAAGVDVTLEVWDGMLHVWHFAARFVPEAREAINRIGEFVRQVGI
jgi:acetyl esterase/lipase